MKNKYPMKVFKSSAGLSVCALMLALFLAAIVYWPGLSGSFIFDDYPNIVDNQAVQPVNASLPNLIRAALSSPSSDLKRPLSSLSFAANYLASGLNPYWMKITNLAIHFGNGILFFFLTRALLSAVTAPAAGQGQISERRQITTAALVAGCWMILPINLTGVLYIVQRMEALANLFIVAGLIVYLKGRQLMLSEPSAKPKHFLTSPGFLLCAASLIGFTAVGVLAKETAVMLPLYAALTEWLLITKPRRSNKQQSVPRKSDWRIIGLFICVLYIPLAVGLAWTLPQVLDPMHWATRSFSLKTRLLSETRIVVDYLAWTILPTFKTLSFYHDDFQASQSLIAPWTTIASLAILIGLASSVLGIRRYLPLVAIGIAFFLGCQLPTATIIPLELVFEHRNYFASYGVMLAIVPYMLGIPPGRLVKFHASSDTDQNEKEAPQYVESLPLARRSILICLILFWAANTWMTSQAWGDPLRLARELAMRAPNSPRAQYELGRTYIIYSHYDPTSPFTQYAYEALEKAATLPNSSILPEQALIFMNSRMGLAQKDAWWDSLINKLSKHKPTVQDESSLGALTQCAREGHCELPNRRMTAAYLAALSHPNPSARLLAMYGEYAWNILNDRPLGLSLLQEATHAAPQEPAYWITLIRMLVSQGQKQEAMQAMQKLSSLNIGGRLSGTIDELSALMESH
ncbi:hypothetical protein [Dyella sedimenti]|uniref:hypothetical protein n=1 Tax=Dyella sedimenti TaxID=2919947 RepID=UPI001FAAEEA6|nr:hypothetical protein [Dyella sedimenti]